MRIAKRVGLALVALLVIGFALVGALYTFRGTPVSRVRAVGDGVERPTLADSTHRQVVSLLAGISFRPGNAVELALNGDGTFPRLWSDLRSARESITLRLYYILPGQVSDSLHAVLSERARAGVNVLFLYDAFGSDFRDGYLESLRAAGVTAAEYRPIRWGLLNRAQNRSHVRAIVVDGRVGWTGGFGIDDKWLGDGRRPEQWRETNVRFVGPAVAQLQAAFVAGWAEATGTLLTGSHFFPPAVPAPRGVTAGVLYTSPSTGSTEAERFLALTINGAARSVYITNPYFVPDDDLRRLLVGAARRGVDVRVVTAGRHTDMAVARLAGRRRYEELLEGGVRLYEYAPTMVHAKTIVVDGVWSSVGTMNFDNRSTALNEESNLVVQDPALGARLQAVFADDLRRSREVTPGRLADRPWYDRILEVGASALVRIL